MSLRAAGAGILPQTVLDALRPREEGLANILTLPLKPIEIPSGKSALQKLASELDRQIEVLQEYVQTAPPEAKADLQHLIRIAREARLDIEGRLLSWAVTSTDRRGADAPVLESAEASAVFALFGSAFSDGEMSHALTVLEAHLAPEDRRINVNDLANATVARSDDSRTSKSSRGVFTRRVGPVLAGLITSRAATTLLSLEPTVAMALNVTAIQLGLQLGRHQGAQSAKNAGFQFGVNRFEGEADHDLGLLYDRATGLAQSLWHKNDGQAKTIVDQQIALLRHLTSKRRESWAGREVSPLEQRAVAKFEQLAAALEEHGVEGARGKLEGLGLKRAELAKLPSLPDLDRAAHPLDDAKTAQAFQTALVEGAKSCLSASNAPLRRLIELLEKRHLENGAPLSRGEEELLRRWAGTAPNVSEVYALGRLAKAGVISFEALWPKGELRGFDGKVLNQEDARLIFDTLGARDQGTKVETAGRVIALLAPFLGSAAAFFAAQAIGAPAMDTLAGWLAMLGTLGAALSANISGFYLGSHVERKGKDIKLSAGLDPAMGLGREYATELPRLFEPGRLLAGSIDEVRDRITVESEVLNVMLHSLEFSREKLQAVRDELVASPAVSPSDQAARDLIDASLRQLDGTQGVHYQVLSSVRDELTVLAGQDSIAGMREGYARARQELFPLMPITWADIITSQTQHELSAPLENFYRFKHQLLGALAEWRPGQLVAGEVARLAEIIAKGRDEIPKDKRPPKDELDQFAARLEKVARKTPAMEPELLSIALEPEFQAGLTRLLEKNAGTSAEPVLLAKQALLTGIRGSRANEALTATLPELAQAVIQAQQALPRSERSDDALDQLASQLVRARAASLGLPKVPASLLAPSFADGLRAQRLKFLPISQERAGEVVQEGVNALWLQLLTLYGLVPDGLAKSPPKLSKINVTRTPGEGNQALPTFRVQGELAGGGKVDVQVDAAGRLSPDFAAFQVDLGSRLLGRMSEEAIRHHLEALAGQAPRSITSTLVSEQADGLRTFAVRTEAGAFEVKIGPRGELDSQAIRAS